MASLGSTSGSTASSSMQEFGTSTNSGGWGKGRLIVPVLPGCGSVGRTDPFSVPRETIANGEPSTPPANGGQGLGLGLSPPQDNGGGFSPSPVNGGGLSPPPDNEPPANRGLSPPDNEGPSPGLDMVLETTD